ncbi:hypothetical protein [Arthrobacter pigmenti]
MSNILIRTSGSALWKEPKNLRYDLESHLQGILAEHPHLIPGVGEGAKACKEFRSDAGLTDLVVVDSDGSITLVECKLASNPQVRREIVGQMFDYASRFWKMNVDDFESQWQARTKSLTAGHPLFDHSDEQNLHLRNDIANNLTQGRFRIVLAVDKINPDLKRMVEYLNSMAGPETVLIAVEYTRLTTGDVEILMPQTYGEEIAEAKTAAEERQQRTWTVDDYRSWIAENDGGNRDKFTRLITEADRRGIPFVGSPVQPTSSIPAGGLRIANQRHGWIGTLYIYHYAGGGTFLELSFANKENKTAMDRLDTKTVDTFFTRVENIPEFKAVAETLQSTKYVKRPNVPLMKVSESSIESLVDALAHLKDDSEG